MLGLKKKVRNTPVTTRMMKLYIAISPSRKLQ
jgi:hypothetical protein